MGLTCQHAHLEQVGTSGLVEIAAREEAEAKEKRCPAWEAQSEGRQPARGQAQERLGQVRKWGAERGRAKE